MASLPTAHEHDASLLWRYQANLSNQTRRANFATAKSALPAIGLLTKRSYLVRNEAHTSLFRPNNIPLEKPVEADTREVDIEAWIIILFADDPDRPIGEDYEFAVN